MGNCNKSKIKQLINDGLTITNIAKICEKPFHQIRKICAENNLKTIDKRTNCIYCLKEFNTNVSRPAKYCSKKCRSAHWPKLYPEKFKAHSKKSRLKCNPIKCRYCNNLVPDSERKSGITYCGDICRKNNREIQNKKLREKNYNEFGKYKISIGCQNPECLYKKCSGSLDFHHVNPQTKSMRISCGLWKANTEVFQKELSKCILLCKNCHYEVHNNILIIEGDNGQWSCRYQK